MHQKVLLKNQPMVAARIAGGAMQAKQHEHLLAHSTHHGQKQ